MKNYRALELSSLLWVYAALAILALGLDFFSFGSPLHAWHLSKSPSQSAVFLGILFVVVAVALAILGSRLWAVELERMFIQILTPLSYVQILILSFLSGFVEEWFFRGAVQPRFGLIFASVFFGLCHLLPGRGLWIWSIVTFISGLILGLFYQRTESLLLVAVLHSSVNALLLVRLNAASAVHHR